MKNLLSCLLSMAFVSVAMAEAPVPNQSSVQRAVELVNEQVLRPLKKLDAKPSRFSREDPPAARRVRVLDTAVELDARGKSFVRFAVDERYDGDDPGTWQREALVGCAYLDDNKVFLEIGADYLPARSVVGGGKWTPDPDVCRAADQAQGVAP
jgi:hypothetical protein